MKILQTIISCLTIAFTTSFVSAQETKCDLHLMAIVIPEQGKAMPGNAAELLENKLCAAISNEDVHTNMDYAHFFVAAKVNILSQEVLPGPPENTAVMLAITLQVGDLIGEKIFASQTLELKGVGNSEERAFTNAFRYLKADNPKIKTLVLEGKAKIIDYFNRNFQNIVNKAQQFAAMKKYEEALYYIAAVPECCNRYPEASQLTLTLYKKYIDENCRILVNEARSIWMRSPDVDGANEIATILTQIDPDAACYGEAMALYKEVKAKIKDDWNFEMRQKYNDAIGIVKSKIEAARAIGVAYGNGQKEQTTNIMWLR